MVTSISNFKKPTDNRQLFHILFLLSFQNNVFFFPGNLHFGILQISDCLPSQSDRRNEDHGVASERGKIHKNTNGRVELDH